MCPHEPLLTLLTYVQKRTYKRTRGTELRPILFAWARRCGFESITRWFSNLSPNFQHAYKRHKRTCDGARSFGRHCWLADRPSPGRRPLLWNGGHAHVPLPHTMRESFPLVAYKIPTPGTLDAAVSVERWARTSRCSHYSQRTETDIQTYQRDGFVTHHISVGVAEWV